MTSFLSRSAVLSRNDPRVRLSLISLRVGPTVTAGPWSPTAPVTIARKSGPSPLMLYTMISACPRAAADVTALVVAAAVAHPVRARAPASTAPPRLILRMSLPYLAVPPPQHDPPP